MNIWPLIPMFVDVLVHSARIPEDYDLSHLLAAGAGAEAMNNTQLQTAQQFLQKHGCKGRVSFHTDLLSVIPGQFPDLWPVTSPGSLSR